MKNLAYRTWGIRGKPALVLLHGFLGDSEDWLPLALELEDDFYLVALDLPGHGKSQTIDITADDPFLSFSKLLNQTLQQLDLKRFSLVGYSLGGRLALMHTLYASQEKNKHLETLFLESCNPGLSSESERKVRKHSDKEWADLFRTEPLDEVLVRWYHQPVFADLDNHQRQSLMNHRLQSNNNRRVLGDALEHYSLSNQPDCTELLKARSIPVHYVYGEKDLKFSGIASTLHDTGCLTGSHKMSAAGHNVHREQPAVMANVIRQLCANNHEHPS